MAITLKDIAHELDLSINTVSRALRDMPDISPSTKKLVRDTASRLGYRKNLAASRLRTNRSYCIGLVVPDITNPSFNYVIRGVESVTRAEGYTIMLGNTNEDASDEEAVISSFLVQGVDGMIIVPTMRNEKVLSIIESAGMPYLLALRKFPSIQKEIVRTDDLRGSYNLAEYLYKLGHRKFLYVAEPWVISSTHERYNGFLSCLRSYGLGEDSLELLESDSKSSEVVFTEWLDSLPDGKLPVTAIFAFCDKLASRIIYILKNRGYRVPEDVSVVGYDNNEYAALIDPPLTTVDSHLFEIGRISANRLLEIIQYSKDPAVTTTRETIIIPELAIRNSAIPPKK